MINEIESEIERFFGPRGPGAARLPDWRERPQQTEMARAVERAVRDRNHLIVEAGTGVGKSLGYLVPALLGAIPQGRRVIVSTHTISLQEQLIGKDIPLLHQLLPMPFAAEVAKGRNNYLAPRRLEVALENAAGSLDGEADLRELRRIEDTWRSGPEGTRQEIHPAPDPAVWEQVQSEHGNCLGKACEHFERDCAYHVARRKLTKADLIVVNHSLFLSDLVLRAQGVRLLPQYDVVVFDEAHTLEAVALDHFGTRLTRYMVRLLLLRLHRPSKSSGFLQFVPNSDHARQLVRRAAGAADDFFDRVADYCGGPGRERELREPGRLSDPLTPALTDLAEGLADLKLASQSREQEVEFQSYIKRVEGMVDALDEILNPVGTDRVHWVETGARHHQVALYSKPLEVRESLRELLFERVGTVVLTSATLAVGGRGGLDFVASSLGADDAERLQLGSPFDYRTHVKLRVPTWLNDPGHGEDYEDRAAQAILHYLERSQGGAFVLFTSYDFMRRMRARVEPRLAALDLPLLVQGQGMSRQLMVESFKEHEGSVLFGTDSFWQGVDVRGDRLRLVIIVRLPFPVPSAPLFRARSELIAARGGNAFREQALPEAIIRFKQGFGRLIRTETDKGTVVVLDTRILNKPYGRAFLKAIPDVPILKD